MSPEKHKLGFKATCDPLTGKTSHSCCVDWYTPALGPGSTGSICLSPSSLHPRLHEHPLPGTGLTAENQSEARLANSISSSWGSLRLSIVSLAGLC